LAYNANNPNGQAVNADSAPVTLSTEQQAQLEAIKTSVQLLDNAIAGSEMQVDVITMPTVTIQDGGGSITVDGVFYQATQPVSLASVPSHPVTNAGTFAVQSTNQANSGVDIGDVTINNASGASAVNIQDGGNSITVDGTITANAGTNLNTSALALEATQSAGNVLTGAVTETAPASDTASSGLNGRLQRIAQRITSLITALGSPFQAGGSIGNTAFGVNNASGASAVNIQDGGNSITVDGINQDLRNDSTDMTVTGLASLASSATVGWQSDRVEINTELDVLVSIKLDMANTAPANDKSVYVYLCSWYYDSATWYGSSLGTATLPTGTNGACTIASAAPNNLKLLGTLAYSTADMVLQDSFLLSNVFGTAMPDAWSIVVINFSGASTHSSGHKLMYKKINQSIA